MVGETCFIQKLTGLCRLQRNKPEGSSLVIPADEPDRSIAQVAASIK